MGPGAGPSEDGSDAAAVEVRGLSVRFGSRRHPVYPVREVSFAVGCGERLAIVGESGAGKSLTALAIMGLVPHPGQLAAGDVRIKSRSVAGLDARAWQRIRGREIAMIFQDPHTSLNPVHTVGRQLVEAIRLHRAVGAAHTRGEALALLERVRIGDAARRLDDFPHQLSGGMRQRVMIAMALANRPEVIIADEPTTALDVTTQAQILVLLDELCTERGTSVVLISHDLGVVRSFCDRVIVMYAGRIVEQGPAAAVFGAPAHPYTRALLGATPPVDRDVERLEAIPGEPPLPARPSAGCEFAPRCPSRFEPCVRRPTLAAFVPGRRCACHLQVAGEPAV